MRLVFQSVLAATLLLASSAHAVTWKERLCQFLLIKKPAAAKTAKVPDVEAPQKSSLWIDDHFKDPDWVMDEALGAYEEFKNIPIELRNQTPLAYYRGQIPLLIHILQSLQPPKNVPYWFMDKDGVRIHEKVQNLEQAVEHLIAEGRVRYLAKQADMEWFPEYVQDVIALRYFLHMHRAYAWQMPTPTEFAEWYQKKEVERAESKYGALIIERGSPEWFAYHVRTGKMDLDLQRQAGALLWPAVTDLAIRHFHDWHLNIKPLGYGQLMAVTLDGQPTDDFDLFGHDNAVHKLPEEFLPLKEAFTPFRDQFFEKIKSEKWDHQILLKLMWFQTTHETSFLYKQFIKLMNGNGIDDLSMRLEDTLMRNGRPDHFVMVITFAHQGELTTSLKNLNRLQLEAEVSAVFKTYQKMIVEIFQKK